MVSAPLHTHTTPKNISHSVVCLLDKDSGGWGRGLCGGGVLGSDTVATEEARRGDCVCCRDDGLRGPGA